MTSTSTSQRSAGFVCRKKQDIGGNNTEFTDIYVVNLIFDANRPGANSHFFPVSYLTAVQVTGLSQCLV